MRLVARDVHRSPDSSNTCRVAVTVGMERPTKELRFWIDIPAAYEDQISLTGNPWLLLMLPIAMASGEAIELELPVDSHLLENTKGLMGVWHGWYPELQKVEVHAPTAPISKPPAHQRAAFFSGGVDSFFTLLRHHDTLIGCGTGQVDKLIFVEGFDIPLTAIEEIASVRHTIAGVSDEFAKTYLPIATNIRDLDTPFQNNWILSHGCAMGAISHILENSLSEILISSTHEYGHLAHIGTHPLTDPLLSSRRQRVIHDGANFSRTEKIAYLGTSDKALSFLRVCYESRRHDNCGRCPKCLLTMAAIDALGLADKATTFDWSAYSAQSLASLLLVTEPQKHRAHELIGAARLRNRSDIAAALQEALDRSVRARRAASVLRRTPILWRYEYQLQRYLMGGSRRNH